MDENKERAEEKVDEWCWRAAERPQGQRETPCQGHPHQQQFKKSLVSVIEFFWFVRFFYFVVLVFLTTVWWPVTHPAWTKLGRPVVQPSTTAVPSQPPLTASNVQNTDCIYIAKMPSLFKKRKPAGKSFPVKISTMDAELEFSLNWKV